MTAKKAKGTTVAAKAPESSACVFCDGKEPAVITVTSSGFPMGANCYEKGKEAEWDENTSLTELRKRIRRRRK